TLLHRRALAVIALDVLDVLGAVTVGLVGQDLLHTALRGAHVHLRGDEEAGLPEAQHEHDRDDDRGQQADDTADDGQRTLRALFGRRGGVGRGLAVLPRLLTRLRHTTGLCA